MTYVFTSDRYGRTESMVDLNRLAADLAQALGGVAEVCEGDRWGRFVMPNGVRVVLYGNGHTDRTRVTVSGHGPDALTGFLGSYTGKHLAWPEVSVSAERPLEKLVADIRKRVLEATVDPLAKLQADYDQWRGITDQVAAQAAALTAAWPMIKADVKTDSPTSRADWSVYDKGVSMGGQINHDGSVRFDRLSVTPDQARAILALILGEAA